MPPQSQQILLEAVSLVKKQLGVLSFYFLCNQMSCFYIRLEI